MGLSTPPCEAGGWLSTPPCWIFDPPSPVAPLLDPAIRGVSGARMGVGFSADFSAWGRLLSGFSAHGGVGLGWPRREKTLFFDSPPFPMAFWELPVRGSGGESARPPGKLVSPAVPTFEGDRSSIASSFQLWGWSGSGPRMVRVWSAYGARIRSAGQVLGAGRQGARRSAESALSGDRRAAGSSAFGRYSSGGRPCRSRL